MMDNFWFIFLLSVLSIALGAIGMLFYMTVIGNYNKSDYHYKPKAKPIEERKEEVFNTAYETNIRDYHYEYTDAESTNNSNNTGYSLKNKCVMAVLFVVCAIVGGYFGYTTMKSIDSVIKENHHQPTINSVITNFTKSDVAHS